MKLSDESGTGNAFLIEMKLSDKSLKIQYGFKDSAKVFWEHLNENETKKRLEGFRIRDATAGTYVKQKTMAPRSAKLKVSAIGLNILPSTPLNDRIGMKTMRMMS